MLPATAGRSGHASGTSGACPAERCGSAAVTFQTAQRSVLPPACFPGAPGPRLTGSAGDGAFPRGARRGMLRPRCGHLPPAAPGAAPGSVQRAAAALAAPPPVPVAAELLILASDGSCRPHLAKARDGNKCSVSSLSGERYCHRAAKLVLL